MSTMEQQFPASANGGTPDRRGQGTMVEQARAASQVQAAVYLARQFPRDVMDAKTRMLEACMQTELAEAAFYAYPRGGKTVTGLTIDAACEIAQIWGNVEYGTAELRRDDEYGQSEMNAYAWDMETNVRNSAIFIVPHTRGDTRNSPRLLDVRDIYETNTNNANRRMREAILKLLPRWYVQAAENALRSTLRRSVEKSGKSLEQQFADAAGWFESEYAVTVAQLEEWARRPSARWDADDLVKLRTLGNSLRRGEIRVEEAFPQAKVTPEEIADGSPPAPEMAMAPEGGPHVHGADPDGLHLWDPLCVECREQSQLRGLVMPNAAPLHGTELFRKLEAETLAAVSTGGLEDVAQRAAKHRDYGALSQDEVDHLDVIGQQRYDALNAQGDPAPQEGESDG